MFGNYAAGIMTSVIFERPCIGFEPIRLPVDGCSFSCWLSSLIHGTYGGLDMNLDLYCFVDYLLNYESLELLGSAIVMITTALISVSVSRGPCITA